MKYLLEIDSIYKAYNGRVLLSDIHLKCETGDIIGVFGRNGSGKSTLFQIIYGTLEAENKFIRLDNAVLQKAFSHPNGISYLPQDNFIPKNFSVKKAVSLCIDKTKTEDFFNDDLIQPLLGKKFSALSAGEAKYLQVRLILCNNSKFCLLDEPYSGIAPVIAEKINELIIRQSASKGIIITDHNYRNLLSVTNKIYLLKNQSLRLLQNASELEQHGYLNTAPDFQ